MKLSLLAVVLLCGCPPSPQPPPAPPDASDARAPVSDSAPEASPGPDAAPAPAPGPLSQNCVAACAAMAAAGCKEGKTPTCGTVMTRVESDRLIRNAKGTPVSCTECAGSKSAADVAELCGSSCTP